MSLDAIFASLAKLGLTMALISAISLYLFKTFFERWLEDKFKSQLETEKHLHSQELIKLQGRFNAVISRVTRLQDREFEALPNIWNLLNQAVGTTLIKLNPVQQYANLSPLGSKTVEAALKESMLTDDQQREVIDTDETEQQALYIWLMRSNAVHSAREAVRAYGNDLTRYSIFIHPSLKMNLGKAKDLLWSAIDESEVLLSSGKRATREESPWFQLQNRIDDLMGSISSEISSRLWTAEDVAEDVSDKKKP